RRQDIGGRLEIMKNEKADKITVALAGNPNSGKTTLFNALTKMRQTVGNWPGVTIEKKEGIYHKNKNVTIVDLPGIYSLTPYSLEEKIARDFLMQNKCDVIINIIDSTNLERSLYLTTQLMETGIKTVIALNMSDETEAKGIKIDKKRVEALTGCKAVQISALKNKNIDLLLDTAVKEAQAQSQKDNKRISFDNKVEDAVQKIMSMLNADRFKAIKVFERDFIYWETIPQAKTGAINNLIASLEKEYNENSNEIIVNQRYKFLESNLPSLLIKKNTATKTLSEKIDKIVTNKYLAFPIFAVVIWLMYFISIQTLGGLAQKGMETLLERLVEAARAALIKNNVADWLTGLTVDGIITGVGAVLTFLPQIILLFFFISFLEGCGYMARVAYIMDRLLRRIGLSGKSFIPMIVGCGCSVPAIMSARTVENNDERRLTIMLTPFIPCSAKLPVFALMVGAFFPDNPFVAPSMYLLGIIMVIIGGLILKKLKIFKTHSDTFMLELPQYRLPTAKNILLDLWEKSKAFLIKAGTIIFLASIILWALQNFNWRFQMVEAEYSLIATIGKLLEPIFIPLGFGDWRAAVALISGIAAKETVVSSLSILLASQGNLNAALGTIFNGPSAYAFMAFVLLSSPCIAALSVTRKEMGSVKWLLITIAFQMLTAYLVSFILYTLGSLFLFNKWIILIPMISAAVGIIVYAIIKTKAAQKEKK
ncbi:MAG: ferrous iron transport protein B, partial [Christensenellales bacterium]